MGLLGSMVALSLVFLRNLHTIFHSGCTKLHSTFVDFDEGHSDKCEVIYHLFFLIVISDVERLFMCLLAICVFSEKYLFLSSAYFLIELFVF